MTAREVAAIRETLGWTYVRLAAVLDCHPQTVMRAERKGCSGPLSVALRALESGWRP